MVQESSSVILNGSFGKSLLSSITRSSESSSSNYVGIGFFFPGLGVCKRPDELADSGECLTGDEVLTGDLLTGDRFTFVEIESYS